MPGMSLSAALQRNDSSTPWGFRLQGGKDFCSPLTIQRVTPGSLADKCGLQAGDIIQKIGQVSGDGLKHKDAQDTIIRAGNHIDFVLQRGGGAPPSAPVSSNQHDNQPASQPPLTSQNADLYNKQTFNKAAAPFNALSQQTQDMSLSSPAQSARYVEPAPGKEVHYEGYTDPEAQSQSFKALKGVVDSGQDPAHVANPPWLRHPVNQTVPDKKYIPSETLKLIQQEEAANFGDEKDGATHSRTFKILQQQLDSDSGVRRGPPPPVQPQLTATAPKSSHFAPKPAGIPPYKPPIGVGGARGKIGDQVMYKSAKEAGLGMKIPICAGCGAPIRGPFVLALGKSWCPDHFVCANPQCGTKLLGVGFVEENGKLYCEKDYATYFAPTCVKCKKTILEEVVNAVGSTWHTGCFVCEQCKRPIGGSSFHIEDGNYYCDRDWQAMFQVKCCVCEFPVEPGDQWVEALSKNWHAECFNCNTCQVNLEGIGYIARNNKPYCKKHGAGGFMS